MFEALLVSKKFLEGAGGGDGGGGMIGEDAHPAKIFVGISNTGEDAEHAENFAAKDEGLRGETQDFLLGNPHGIVGPRLAGGDVGDEKGIAAGADDADFADAEGDAAEFSISIDMNLAAEVAAAGAGGEMEAGGLFRAIVAKMALVAKVGRAFEPDADKGGFGSFVETIDDDPEEGREGFFLGKTEEG